MFSNFIVTYGNAGQKSRLVIQFILKGLYLKTKSSGISAAFQMVFSVVDFTPVAHTHKLWIEMLDGRSLVTLIKRGYFFHLFLI